MARKRGIESELEDLTEGILGDLELGERVRHLWDACAREDWERFRRLWDTTPRKTYRMADATMADTYDKGRLIGFHIRGDLLSMACSVMETHGRLKWLEVLTVAARATEPDDLDDCYTWPLREQISDYAMTYRVLHPEVEKDPALNLACSYCDAEPGESCRTRSGETTDPHKARTDAAKEIYPAAWEGAVPELEDGLIDAINKAGETRGCFLVWHEAYRQAVPEVLNVTLDTLLGALEGQGHRTLEKIDRARQTAMGQWMPARIARGMLEDEYGDDAPLDDPAAIERVRRQAFPFHHASVGWVTLDDAGDLRGAQSCGAPSRANGDDGGRVTVYLGDPDDPGHPDDVATPAAVANHLGLVDDLKAAWADEFPEMHEESGA